MEYIIENLTKKEIDILVNSDEEWYPDDLESTDVVIPGTERDVDRVLKLIGRM